jgi:hypothetical protein
MAEWRSFLSQSNGQLLVEALAAFFAASLLFSAIPAAATVGIRARVQAVEELDATAYASGVLQITTGFLPVQPIRCTYNVGIFLFPTTQNRGWCSRLVHLLPIWPHSLPSQGSQVTLAISPLNGVYAASVNVQVGGAIPAHVTLSTYSFPLSTRR